MDKNILNKADLENVVGGSLSDFRHPSIDELVTDDTYRHYKYDQCGKGVWLYGSFFGRDELDSDR